MTVSETVTITLPLQPTMRAMVRMELTETKTVSETVKIMLLLQPTMRATVRMELTVTKTVIWQQNQDQASKRG